jgi:hypothetical protein
VTDSRFCAFLSDNSSAGAARKIWIGFGGTPSDAPRRRPPRGRSGLGSATSSKESSGRLRGGPREHSFRTTFQFQGRDWEGEPRMTIRAGLRDHQVREISALAPVAQDILIAGQRRRLEPAIGRAQAEAVITTQTPAGSR